MACRKIKKLLSPFMDGELPEEDRQKVADHLERCSSCRHRLESLHKVEALSRQLATTEPDEIYWSTFLPRLRARMARAQKRSSGQKIREALGRPFAPPVPWVRIAGAVAAAVLVFILGRAVIHHEARMSRVRALPKKLLTEQVTVHPERVLPRDVMEADSRGPAAQKPTEPHVRTDKDVTEPLEKGAVKGKVAPSAVPPPPPEEAFVTPDQIAQTEEQASMEKGPPSPVSLSEDEDAPVGRGQELMALDRAGKKEMALQGLATAGRASGLDHWRRQIELWQDSVKTQPSSDHLEKFHFRLAEGWYQLALLTEQRGDVLRALEAQLAALDFAAEESSRDLLRGRVLVLEEHLRKK